jgi:hypothetical protein
MREFYHSPGLAKSLHPGQTLIVTSNGKPDLIVTKAGTRKLRTAKDWQKRARELISKPTGRKVDTVALLRKLRS